MRQILLMIMLSIFFSDTLVQAQGIESAETDVAAIVNDIRAYNGLPAVVIDPALVSAAKKHAEDMSRGRFISHTGSDGSQVAQRVLAAGFCFHYVNENIAEGFREFYDVVSAWMSSNGHRGNILAARATHFGFAETNRSWVMVLATPC